MATDDQASFVQPLTEEVTAAENSLGTPSFNQSQFAVDKSAASTEQVPVAANNPFLVPEFQEQPEKPSHDDKAGQDVTATNISSAESNRLP